MQDPVISARVTDNVVEKLKKYITNYRTQKAKKDLEFTEKVLKEAQDAYYKAQQTYAAFEDGNKNIVSASYRTELERLKNEMTLTFNVYNTLAQKQEQDKLRVQEQTPVYTIIEPASVPLKASTPKKVLILIGCIFLDLIAISGICTDQKQANILISTYSCSRSYDRLICNPLSERLISTKRAFGLCGEAVSCLRICKAASGSLATIYR